MDQNQSLRAEVDRLLSGRGAHADFDAAVAGFPAKLRGTKPEGAPHSAWELLEHMRIAQNDILRFSLSAGYVSPGWPDGYWPAAPAPARPSEWGKSVRAFRKDLAEFVELIRDPARDLHKKFPWGDGQTLMREALLIADHNSYHLGQLALVRKLLGLWK